MNKTKILLIIFLTISACKGFAGDLIISSPGKKLTANFDAFQGTFETLPEGFSVSTNGYSPMSYDHPDFRGIKIKPQTTGGCYAWELGSGDYALGCQPTLEDFTPGWFMLSISNACNTTIREITIAYDVVCRNDEDRSSIVTFEYCTDNMANSAAANKIYQFDFISPELGDTETGWTTNALSSRIKLAKVLPIGSILRCIWKFDDYSGSGSRDEFGINNFSIIFHKPNATSIAIQ